MTYEISSDERFAGSLRYIVRRLAGAGTICEIARGERMTVLVRSKVDITGVLIDALADIIITDCKAYYIDENIKLPIRDRLSACAFVSVLSAFDRDTDKVIAKTLVRLTGRLHLDSLYEFGLYLLKSRWDEVIQLANENICYLVCQKTFMELLHFLLSNVDQRSEEAHIVQNGERMEVLGGGLKPIENVYINESLPDDIQIVNKLVAIAPKKIFLHIPNTKLQDSIQTIFEGISTCTIM